ncbi:ATP-dependent acyl-CoA ligase [Metabacillus arenae]|uniref:ATP-dependent acyl-CoA ligase n=1 Tax=Metabacillus arenae TaxID=2771434 RepID=A0A926NND2_9BACI|nr:ATP-dependent acyl-CoA ligase [Metabacillus arenae]MBD1380991.1 ATP-dependent acyl-CoA ligase [Metabacillus arenae]
MAKEDPHKEWLFFEEQIYTFEELNRNVNRVANILSTLEVSKGDKVAIIMANSPEFLNTWFALAKIGAVMVPINTTTKGEMLAYILNHSDAKALFIHDEFYPLYLEIKNQLDNIQHVICVEGANLKNSKMALSYQELFKNSSDIFNADENVKRNDLMCILYTSGTTGLPKGVMLSHNSYFITGEYTAKYIYEFKNGDRIYTCLPLFHVNAQQVTTMPALLTKTPLVLAKKFSASNFWRDMVRYEVTVFKFIGAMLSILYKQQENEFEHQHKVRLATGSPVPKEIWKQCEKRYNIRLLEGYGSTETATACLYNTLQEFRIGSCGKPLPHFDVRIFDENDRELPANQPGEIVVKAFEEHVLMKGYFKMPDKTEEAMRGGWFHTGDRGYRDEDGYFYFVDRMKDSIRRRGENISSYMVEKAITDHPKVLECAAVGVPDELSEEEVMVYIRLQPGEELEPQDLINWCKEHMSSFMIPRYVEFVEDFPRTPTQRIQKYKLRVKGIGQAWDRVKCNLI